MVHIIPSPLYYYPRPNNSPVFINYSHTQPQHMLHDQRTPPPTTTRDEEFPDDNYGATEIREIHALTSPSSSYSSTRVSGGGGDHRPESWSSRSATGSDVENFTSMSHEFNALVVAGSTLETSTTDSVISANTTTTNNNNNSNNVNLGRIGEEEEALLEETNPLAIVPDTSNPIPSPRRAPEVASTSLTGSRNSGGGGNTGHGGNIGEEVSVYRVKKEEVESKITAWQTAEIAKINNRFKREDVVIHGWESERVEKATAWLKKVERKLDEQRARAIEKMENDVAKARRKAEEKRASAEAKRGTKVAKILEMSNLLRAVGRAPSKRSFF